MLSRSGRWLFIHVPKTAGNSLQCVLQPFSEDRLFAKPPRDGVEDFELAGPVTPQKHASLADYSTLLPEDVFASLFVFTVTRDPWERAISHYFGPLPWTGKGDPTWSEERFVARLGRLRSIASMTSLDGRISVDFMLRFECLHEDFAALLRRLRLPPQELPHRNRGLAPRPWQTYYARHPNLVELVAEHLADDIEAFGYRPPTLTH